MRPVRPRPLGVVALEGRALPATLIVNTASELILSDGLLSLREAMAAVNAGSAAGLDAGAAAQISGTFGADDEIGFAAALAGRVLLLRQRDGNPANVFGPTALVVTRSVTIDGSPGGAGVTLDADGRHRLFAVAGGAALVLRDLELTGGRAAGGEGGSSTGGTGSGGGGGAGLGGATLSAPAAR